MNRSWRHAAFRVALIAASAAMLAARAPKTPAPSPTVEVLPLPPPLSVGAMESPPSVATPGLTAKQRFEKAVNLLEEGRPEEAKAELLAYMLDRPGDPRGQSLLDQLDKDPRELLGTESFAYTARPGETLSTIAERFLGDALKFYALARYNGIEAPAQMEPGRTLQIPGSPRVEAPPPRRLPRPEPERRAPPPPRPVQRPLPPVVAPAARVDPQQAARLRRSALVQMQGGSIDAAVRSLEAASQLDPGSAPVRADLDRARRIQGAVRKR